MIGRLALAAAFAVLIVVPALAQNQPAAPPVRVRGTIEKVDDANLTVKAKDGADVKVAVTAPTVIQSAIERTKQAASGEDVQAIRQAVSDLQVAAQAMTQHMHQPSGDGAAPGAAGGGEDKGKDDVIDAEFEVKK